MLKKTFLILVCILVVFITFSQTKNRLSILYSSASNGVDIPSGWYCDCGYAGKGATLFELRYSRKFNSYFSVETGLQFAQNQIEGNSHGDGVNRYTNLEINLLSIPIYGNLTFLKYFFVEAGPTIDFESNHSTSLNDQSGIGFAYGLGGKYTFKNVTVIVNPFFQRHLMLLTGSENYIKRLYGSGIKFGVGYNF